jgi:tetratricopeptide (TPR) repeat protein
MSICQLRFGFLAALAGVVLLGCHAAPQAKEADFLKRGDSRLAAKDYARALLEYRNASAAMPKDAEPHYRAGLVYLDTRDVRSAIQEFRRAIGLNPKHSGAQLKLAELMTATRNPELIQKAAQSLVDIFGASPSDPEVLDTLALAQWKLGKPEEATQMMEQALKRFPAYLQSSVTLARMKLSRKDWSGAEEVLKKAAADAPRSSQAALALGNVYAFLQQPAKAEPEIARAVQLDPKNGDALLSLAALQRSAKRIDEADRTYRQLAKLPDKAYKPVHAVFLYQTGKREAAVVEFEALARADPDDRDARTRLVAAYSGQNRIADMERVLSAALTRNPKDTDALLQRAELRLRTGKADDAGKDLLEVLRYDPNSAAAHFALAGVYGTQGLADSRRQELQQALKLNPGLLAARLSLEMGFLSAKQNHAALAIIDEAPPYQKTDVRWILGRNWALLSLGNLQEAKAGVDKALQQGRTPAAVFQAAALRFIEKDYTGCRGDLAELLKTGAINLNAADLLMQTYLAQRDALKGLERLKELAAAQPKSAPLQSLLGQWYLRTGNPGGARQAFQRAKGADPHFAAADLALADLDLHEGHADAAKQRMVPVVAADPRNTNAMMLLAHAEYDMGDHAAEAETYRKILTVDPLNVVVLNNLAYFLVANSPDEALKFAQQAAEIDPNSPTVQDTLGWIYYRKGLYEMAVRYLKSAVDKEPNPRRQFHLGMSYLKSGNQMMGQKIVLEATRRDPSLVKTEQGF